MNHEAVAERLHEAHANGASVIVPAVENVASTAEFARSVVEGLQQAPRFLDCAWLYDLRGSELFELITEQPEYYLTRTEAGILRDHADDISRATGAVRLLELGSGYSVKTKHILSAYLDRVDAPHYVPIDVSVSALRSALDEIESSHPGVTFSGIIGYYESVFPLLPRLSPCMVIFLGSTFGNLNETASRLFLTDLANWLSNEDFVLLGLDLVKEVELIERAYNDAAGVTAEFTVNILARMNRELGSDIDLETVEHVSYYNHDRQSIETFVEFEEAQEIYIEPYDRTFEIEAGERISVEISRKFDLEQFVPELSDCGLEVVEVFKDEREWFALLLLRRRR